MRSGNLSSFPWLTGRDAPAMIRYAPYFVDPADPVDSPIRVRTPAGADLALAAPELARELAEQHGAPVLCCTSERARSTASAYRC